MERKPKLTIPQQVEYMENHCGIRFEICSKENAIEFLENSTYFFKIKAFAKNYEKKDDKYIDLDFAYLKELSTLDMHIRKEILSIALDVEHYLKVWLIRDLSARDEADGYDIIEKFFSYDPSIKEKIKTKSQKSVCKDLSEALEQKGYALWNVIELLSFGDFCDLYYLYCQEYNVKSKIHDLLLSVKCIRNAAAHNNCLLNSLRQPYTKAISTTNSLNATLSKTGISARTLNKKLENPVSHDFTALLIAYDRIVRSKKAKEKTFSHLKELFENRIIKNKKYFEKNSDIVSYYHFAKKVIDYLYSKNCN